MQGPDLLGAHIYFIPYPCCHFKDDGALQRVADEDVMFYDRAIAYSFKASAFALSDRRVISEMIAADSKQQCSIPDGHALQFTAGIRSRTTNRLGNATPLGLCRDRH